MAIIETTSTAAQGRETGAGGAPQTFGDRLCAPAAARDAQDPIGTANHTARMFITELPTPWNDARTADPEGSMTQRLRAVQMEIYERNKESGHTPGPLGGTIYYGTAPDPEWSTPGIREVVIYTRPEGPFARYDAARYRLPTDSLDVLEMLRLFYDDPDELARFAHLRVDERVEPLPRQLYVCTHGSVDICCAKFGIPAYRTLRDHGDVQTWRTTHFGGHRFAPTLKDYPNGYTWGFIDGEAASALVAGPAQPAAALAPKMRGWSGVPGPVQLLDREGLVREGWDWLDYRRDGRILDHDEDDHRWRVALTFETPNGRRGRYEGTVEVGRELPNPGCGAHWGEYDGTSPEYRLASFHDRSE